MSKTHPKVERQFAWLPALIRSRIPGVGPGPARWVWLRKYTRLYFWHPMCGHYRTWDTWLGWDTPEIYRKTLYNSPTEKE